MNPKYPIYIVSKGRWEQRLTVRALNEINVFGYRVVIEEEEYAQYAKHIDKKWLLVLPKNYLEHYETCDSLGASKSRGPGPARNFCWDHSTSNGHSRHWVMDDNCQHFYRLNRNLKVLVSSGTIFRCAEDFIDRYANVALSGLNYHGLCKQTDAVPPYILNTRIYSFILINNSIQYRWRARYNEDTDLSLRVLKDGWCTVQFNAFLAEKIMTQRNRGGNTDEFYAQEGTLPKSQMLADLHPDVATVVQRFGRWHHKVDYRQFKDRKLVRKKGVVVKQGVNNYGMVLQVTPRT